jgi:hypothetical protein
MACSLAVPFLQEQSNWQSKRNVSVSTSGLGKLRIEDQSIQFYSGTVRSKEQLQQSTSKAYSVSA